MPGFYDAGPLQQIAINLFHGWGYNFYRVENQLRADDQLIRTKAAWLLGLAVASLSAAEADYRREFLPAPSRAKPFPDPAAVATAQHLERTAHAIRALEAALHQLPTPEHDRMTQRYRQEAPTLQTLINGQPAAIIEKLPDIETGLAAIRSTLESRQAVLLNPAR